MSQTGVGKVKTGSQYYISLNLPICDLSVAENSLLAKNPLATGYILFLIFTASVFCIKDIRSQLPDDAKRFEIIDSDLKELLVESEKIKNMIESATREGLQQKLEDLLERFEFHYSLLWMWEVILFHAEYAEF